MTRRWLIRILFMQPIMMCLIGWAWSTTHDSRIVYTRGNSDYGLSSSGYIVVLYTGRSGSNPVGWSSSAIPHDAHFFSTIFSPEYDRFLGFGGSNDASEFGVSAPYWCFLLFFSLILLFVWFKKPATSSVGAFPVEISSKDAPP